jgi:hypothetical protein
MTDKFAESVVAGRLQIRRICSRRATHSQCIYSQTKQSRKCRYFGVIKF